MATVTSADGTRVSYLSTGSGPGLLVVPGALTCAADFTGLAAELGRHFTVHVVERRGRGDSGPQGAGYGIAAECADLAAVQARTGATRVFGHSFGGLVALEFARNNPSIEALAVYEPGVSIAGNIPIDWAPRCSGEIAAGHPKDAFVTFVRGVNPEATGRAPRWLLTTILPLAIRGIERKYALMPTAVAEHLEVARLDDAYPHYREVNARTLILAGSRSATAKATAKTLADVLPGGRTLTLSGLDHFGPEKHPGKVADAVSAFLTASAPARR